MNGYYSLLASFCIPKLLVKSSYQYTILFSDVCCWCIVGYKSRISHIAPLTPGGQLQVAMGSSPLGPRSHVPPFIHSTLSVH